MSEILDRKVSLSELPQIARLLTDNLKASPSPFIVSLTGRLGAGKTELTRNMLWSLGLSKEIPVQSPTFSYFNEYQVGSDLYLHIDLYRCQGSLPFLDLLGRDPGEYRGYFIEWFDQCPGLEVDLGEPTHLFSLDFAPSHPNERHLLARELTVR